MASNKQQKKELHVVMFPWLAFGHITPFLELSKSIAAKGHKISFISTPRNIDRLPKLPPDLESSITMVEIPLPPVDGLSSENAEATMDIQPEEMPYLKEAMDGMETEVTRFLERTSPDWIIFDFAQYWIPPVAAKLGISRCFFNTASPWFSAFYSADFMMRLSSPLQIEDFLARPKCITFETKARFRRYEAKWILSSLQKVSAKTDMDRITAVKTGSDLLISRHCNDFEPKWVSLLQTTDGRPMLPTGLMPPTVHVSDDLDRNEDWISIKQWLDGHKKCSVVYVALGSEVVVGLGQISELACGLEKSGVPFFWTLRTPPGNHSSLGLPDGFEERVKGRGVVWKTWAPQKSILSHDSIGGFLTHCGWSSTIEGITFGHPLVMLPFLIDQGFTARVMEDNQVGIEVPRDEEDGVFTSDSVADSIRFVMLESEVGKKLRENAQRISLIFGDTKSNGKCIEDLIDFMAKHTKN
ncbi:unnamed protein product [Cuscuta epithymum]|uniref:Glycosyltransferase n=1 Tax=Cuscuta epithymum TaxID=186058 RepID=A0AAV0C950_9ASTE|nr:unnamed protein product [Cuscuta epithymum]CAH9116735.1 unnamed protein product [Cuscuta epithymum]CAH9139034.1 unnamed protein product [Cuscuta epithymum]